jgi:hypothetical protein
MVCSDSSRTWLRAISTLGTGLAVMLGPRVAGAQTFPQDNQWLPLTCDGRVATDPVGDVQPPAIDVVGDAADPAAYVFMDAAWLYLRLRMSATVLQSATTYAPYGWACLVRTAGTRGSYLVWDGVDGLANPNDVALLQNAHPHPGNPTQQPASTVVATYAAATSAREAAATSQLGGNPNFFVDWAVALADLAKVGITPSTPVTFICGTTKTEHVMDEDVVAQQLSCGGVLDTVECVGGGCAACTTSTACGPGCVACGGATPVCDPAFGCTAGCTTDAECGGATPVCDTGPGRCVGCASDTNCLSGTTCSTPLGLCIGCASDAQCHPGAFCDNSSGTCTPCAQGAASCTGAGNGGTGNAAGPDVIEGGSCACDIVGGSPSTGSLAALALGSVAALSARARRRRRRKRALLHQRRE